MYFFYIFNSIIIYVVFELTYLVKCSTFNTTQNKTHQYELSPLYNITYFSLEHKGH